MNEKSENDKDGSFIECILILICAFPIAFIIIELFHKKPPVFVQVSTGFVSAMISYIFVRTFFKE